MLLAQKKRNTRYQNVLSYSVLTLLLLFCLWSSRLLLISRPIEAVGEVLGTETAGAGQLNTLSLSAYPIYNQTQTPPDLSRYWLLLDAPSKKIIIAKNPTKQIPIASTTKIMTALLVLENSKNLDELIEIDKKALAIYMPQSKILWGEQWSVKNLLYFLLLESDNQVASVLANYVAIKKNPKISSWDEGIQSFINLMNQRAKTLGLTNTTFKDPAGLDENTISSTFDISIITSEALSNQLFKKIISTKEISLTNGASSRIVTVKNSNRLVSDYNYPGIIGGKTGFLPNQGEAKLSAGHCLITAAERNGHILIAAVFNTYGELPSSSAVAAKALLDYGFANTSWY